MTELENVHGPHSCPKVIEYHLESPGEAGKTDALMFNRRRRNSGSASAGSSQYLGAGSLSVRDGAKSQ